MQFSFTKGTREFLFWQMRDRLSPICTNWTTATLSLADCCAASALKMIDLQYVKKYHLQRAQQMWWYNAPLWFTVRKSNYVGEMKDWWQHAGLSILFSLRQSGSPITIFPLFVITRFPSPGSTYFQWLHQKTAQSTPISISPALCVILHISAKYQIRIKILWSRESQQREYKVQNSSLCAPGVQSPGQEPAMRVITSWWWQWWW